MGSLARHAEIRPFRQRFPWIGADLQTLRNTLLPAATELPGGARLLLALRDGDRLSARLDRPKTHIYAPLIVLIHGLTGSESSPTVRATARHLVQSGWTVLRLNLNGSAPSRPTASSFYHAGKTQDLADALLDLPRELTRGGIVLVGHSLGGNLVLKFMGEGAHGVPVQAAVAVSAPLDLAATCRQMLKARNRVYQRHMLEAMRQEALAPGAALEMSERDSIVAARTIFDFDDRFIARRFGFRDAGHYYAENSSGRFLGAVQRPTLVLHAVDDPWIPTDCYDAIPWSRLPAIEAILTQGGGHLGFHERDNDIPWHDRATSAWLAARIGGALTTEYAAAPTAG
jgi:predicted alpha/beta-fold hydrolase